MRAHVRQAGGEAGCPQEKVEMENVNVNNEYTTVNYSTRSTKAASGSGGVACVIGRILHELRVTSRILLARGLHAPPRNQALLKAADSREAGQGRLVRRQGRRRVLPAARGVRSEEFRGVEGGAAG